MRIPIHNVADCKHQCDTYTVKDLINTLKKCPPIMPVVGEWDTHGSPICNIRVTQGNDLFKDAVVVLDVSDMWFKSKC